jgi:hypothetical protein
MANNQGQEQLFPEPGDEGNASVAKRRTSGPRRGSKVDRPPTEPLKERSTEPVASTVAKGAQFERQVAEVYRSLNWQVDQDRLVVGNQADLVIRRLGYGVAPDQILAVECKAWEKPVDPTTMSDFVARIQAAMFNQTITGGVLVAKKVSAHSREVLRNLPTIEATTFSDLVQALMNQSLATADLVQRYEEKEVYRSFLHLSADLYQWNQSDHDRSYKTTDQAERQLVEHLLGMRDSLTLVLGDYRQAQ